MFDEKRRLREENFNLREENKKLKEALASTADQYFEQKRALTEDFEERLRRQQEVNLILTDAVENASRKVEEAEKRAETAEKFSEGTRRVGGNALSDLKMVCEVLRRLGWETSFQLTTHRLIELKAPGERESYISEGILHEENIKKAEIE